MSNECKLKKKCPVRDTPGQRFKCWNPECKNQIHQLCCKSLLDHYGIPIRERPTEEDALGTDKGAIVFCTKGCFGKWRVHRNKEMRAIFAVEKEAAKIARKRKVPWEEDGSLGVSLDWLTTEGTCALYCGGNKTKGLTKGAHQKQIAIIIKTAKPDTDRNDKDVENKINSLER